MLAGSTPQEVFMWYAFCDAFVFMFRCNSILSTSFRITHLVLAYSWDCPGDSEATMKDMGKCIKSVHQVHDINKTKQNTEWYDNCVQNLRRLLHISQLGWFGTKFKFRAVRPRRLHYDVIKWIHFLPYCPLVRGINWSPVDYSHKG